MHPLGPAHGTPKLAIIISGQLENVVSVTMDSIVNFESQAPPTGSGKSSRSVTWLSTFPLKGLDLQ